MGQKVLVIGSGAREHTIAYTLLKAPSVDEVTVAPGNPDNPVAPGRPDGNALPQSGQLNWPIPFMACSGVLLFAVGWVLDRKETLA